MFFNCKYFNIIFSYLLVLILILRATVFRSILPDSIFNILIFIIDIYIYVLFAIEKGKINVYGFYLICVCFFSLLLNQLLGQVNPILNSWFRFFLFISVFLIIGPLIVSNRISDFRNCLFKVALSSLFILNLVCLVAVFTLRDFSFFEGYAGFLESSILLGTTTSFGMILCLVNFFYTEKKLFKFFYFFIFFISVPLLLLTAARSAILSLIITLMVIYVVNYKKSTPFLLFTAVIVMIFFSRIQPFAQPLLDKMEKRESGDITAGRGGINYDNYLDFKDNPIIGSGFYNIIHSSNSKINPDGSLEYSSGWLFALSSTGFLGFAYLLYVLFVTLKRLRLLNSLPNKEFVAVIFMIYFFINMNFEGYIYSGGGILFFLFWLSFSFVTMINIEKKHETFTN